MKHAGDPHGQPLTRGNFLLGLAATSAAATLGCGDGDSGDGGSGGSGGAAGSSGGTAGAGGNAGAGGGAGSGASGGNAGAAGSSGEACATDIDAQITCRHDHRMIVPAADLAEGTEKTYDIRGTNQTHGHDVTVTAEMFARLRAGETVEIFVESIFQPHTVHLSCAGLDPAALDDEACN